MSRRDYEVGMKSKLREVGFRIDTLKAKLAKTSDYRQRVDLRGEIERLEVRRDEVATKLHTLQKQPEGAWANFKAQFELEWDALVEDVEERIGRLV